MNEHWHKFEAFSIARKIVGASLVSSEPMEVTKDPYLHWVSVERPLVFLLARICIEGPSKFVLAEVCAICRQLKSLACEV